jgi:adenylate cyclase
VGDSAQLFPTLWGLWQFSCNSGEHAHAYEFGRQLLSFAENSQTATLRCEAHYTLGLTALCCGDLSGTIEHCEQSIALYDPQQHHAHVLAYGQNSSMPCLGVEQYATGAASLSELAAETQLPLERIAQHVAEARTKQTTEIYLASCQQLAHTLRMPTFYRSAKKAVSHVRRDQELTGAVQNAEE